MFSALSKLVSFVYQHEDESDEEVEEENNVNNSNHNSYGYRSGKELESVKNFNGNVTHVFENHGLINGEIYFSFDTVIDKVRLKVNDAVHVVAKQQTDGGVLITEQVSLIKEDWDDQEVEVNNHEEDSVQDGIVGKVTKFDGNEGIIQGYVYFDMSNVIDDYIPKNGDYVKADYHQTENDTKIENVQPLRYLEKESKITGFQFDHGYIDGEIFFYAEACVDGYKPCKWDKVIVKAIESEQRKCTWRAVSIKPISVVSSTRYFTDSIVWCSVNYLIDIFSIMQSVKTEP
jgi:hypothetical protein